MKRQWPFLLLFVLCAVIIVLQITGGFTESMQMIARAKPGVIAVPGPRALVIDALSFVAWIWGIVLAARAKQWKWMLLALLTGYIGGCIYSLFSLLKKERKEDGEPRPALTVQ